MRIALVNQWYPPDYGGVGVYNGTMARAFVALGHEVTVITARSTPDQPPVSVENGVTIYRVPRRIEPYQLRRIPIIWSQARSMRHLLYSRAVCSLLADLYAQHVIDIVEFAEINAEGWWSATMLANHIPTVVRCHTPHVLLRLTTPVEEALPATHLIEHAEAACVRRAHALTAPSTDLARRVEHEMGLRSGRVNVIPNAIDTDEFQPGLPRQGSNAIITILYVGRISREKGAFVLAEALCRLSHMSPALPAWRAILVGSDRSDAFGRSNKAALTAYFAEHGLDDRVHMQGFVAQSELRALYQSADICTVPSLLYESFSYTCAQAMACAKPVIASTMGGMPEVVGDGALLVAPNDSASLADALAHLLREPELRGYLGQAGRQRALHVFSHLAVARSTLTLYEQVVHQREQARAPISHRERVTA